MDYHYVRCMDCGSRLRVSDLVTLSPHDCVRIAATVPRDRLPLARVYRCLCGAALNDEGSCSEFVNNLA